MGWTEMAESKNISESESILQVERLSVRYGKVEALHDGKLAVGPGQIVSVIGPNGAGKSTLLNTIMGALPSTGFAKGTIRYRGEDISSLAVEKRVSRGMCLVPEKRELFASMTVVCNLSSVCSVSELLEIFWRTPCSVWLGIWLLLVRLRRPGKGIPLPVFPPPPG